MKQQKKKKDTAKSTCLATEDNIRKLRKEKSETKKEMLKVFRQSYQAMEKKFTKLLLNLPYEIAKEAMIVLDDWFEKKSK